MGDVSLWVTGIDQKESLSKYTINSPISLKVYFFIQNVLAENFLKTKWFNFKEIKLLFFLNSSFMCVKVLKIQTNYQYILQQQLFFLNYTDIFWYFYLFL